MRTTVTLADDVSAAIAEWRRERGVGLSEAVNELVRLGLVQQAPSKPFTQRTYEMGMLIDISDVQEALDIAEDASLRR